MPRGEQAQPTSVGWDFRGGTSCGGVGGIASKLLTCMCLPPTNLNVCRLRDYLGQPLKESAGEKPISETCGRPASWSSLKTTRKPENPRRKPRGHDPQEETAGPKKESAAAERTISAGRQERGGQKSRRTVSEGVTETGAPADVEPPGGTRSVDPMPARGRADSGPPEAPITSKESPIDVDEEQDVEMGPPQQRGADGGAKPPGQPRGGGRFHGRPRGFTTWRTRPRTTAGLGAKHLATLARRATGGAGKR